MSNKLVEAKDELLSRLKDAERNLIDTRKALEDLAAERERAEDQLAYYNQEIRELRLAIDKLTAIL